ncbi:Unknown protein sequence [Pseudomonas syringae pv. broussonetiae]|uniref:Uncharacterized protein n=1 Tax=Pseudomonas savastanoi TaxID=29438 RepID=A0A3M5KBY8_PSESS|nr:hypothetical protein [Pseudomonas savastanoi]KPW44607.1 Unknown protein sequence [Pseudomonas syringae pv. broussonetiae]KWT05717.1 hypothetical protein AL047_23255 [Pseudomonas syringae pv. broussonetiae]RMT33087.1 hypothetical protein ALP51_03867 [Pseudomonas savastanoi]
MIRKTILFTFAFLLIYFSAGAFANSATDVTLKCAQVSVNIGDKNYAVTGASSKICEKDFANNMKDRLFSTGIFSVDKENNSLVMLGEFLGVILWYVIAVVLGLPALYWLVESSRQENENAVRNLIITLCAIIASAILAYQPISMAISNYAYRTFISAANYSFTESINNQEMLTLAPKIDTTDNVVNANVFANRLIQVALRNEFTERYISQAAYGRLDNDYESDCILICTRKEISVTEYFKRVYSCNKIQPFYLVETMNNTENSLLDWSRTQQNTEIQFNHIEECADNYKYQKEIYGHAYSNAKILYPALNPIGKSYANNDIVENVAAFVQMLNKVVDTVAGTVKSQYGGYKGTTESQRMEMVNSGYVADYNKVKPTAAVQAAADYMLKCATDIIDENSGSSIWTTTLKDIPGAEPTLGLQAINKCRDALLGSSRTSQTEILPIYEDALKAAKEILKLKCNLPLESLTRQTAIINSNGEVPYLNSYATKATNAFTSLQTSCVSINENGIFPTTSYTEEEREISFKIVQEMKIAITGWVMTVYEARNLAVGMFYERYKSKFQASQFAEYGYTFQSLQFLESLKASDGTSLLEANSTIIPEIVIEGDLDFNTDSSYLNEKIVSAKKRN